MNMKIRNIILWPKNHLKSIRNIEFDPSKINIITGDPQTGKSALIHIIDYCLGSNKCTIPVGKIREKTEWFGVLLQLDNTQILLARLEPKNKKSTGEMYMDEGTLVEIVKYPSSNCNLKDVRNRLNDLAGLTNLDFRGDNSGKNYSYRPSFRDMSAFGFQPQHIIANPYTLFFKADTNEHRNKLRTVFPLVLGAIENKHLILKRELSELENKLNVKRNELKNREQADNVWKAELRGMYLQGREFGL